MTDRMKPEVKALWLAALRSGQYKQGRGYLQRDDEFCCLGVLCEVAIQQGVEVPKDYGDERWVAYGRGLRTSSLPSEVAAWSGVTGMGDLPAAVGDAEDLANLNDMGASFTRIAGVIEEQL